MDSGFKGSDYRRLDATAVSIFSPYFSNMSVTEEACVEDTEYRAQVRQHGF